jgi:hypothetical protein
MSSFCRPIGQPPHLCGYRGCPSPVAASARRSGAGAWRGQQQPRSASAPLGDVLVGEPAVRRTETDGKEQ